MYMGVHNEIDAPICTFCVMYICVPYAQCIHAVN